MPGGTRFFPVVTFNRRQFLTTELARRCLRSAWEHVQRYHPFRAEAVCLLPDHLHCLWTLPPGDMDFSRRWRIMKGVFSKQYLAAGGFEAKRNNSRERKGEVALWQRRFWEHLILDEEDFQRHFDYIHFNPVKHGHVDEPAKWPWSTFCKHVRLGHYDPGWGAQEPNSIKGLACWGE
ncbi:MAG: transposase [bacterium]